MYLVAFGVLNSRNQHQQVHISYTTFQQQVEAGNVTSVTSQGNQVDGQTSKPVSDMSDSSKSSTSFSTVVPQFAGGSLEPLLRQHHVNVAAQSSNQGSTLTTMLASFGPIVLLILVLVWFYRRQMASGGGPSGGLFGFGQSQARLYDA